MQKPQRAPTIVNRHHDHSLSGQVLAIVGPSGAGKSTLLSLLLRFITAQQGEIRLDGTDISLMRARELRQQVALVPQRTTVFSGTIAEAIRFGRRATDDEVRDAARLANADDFIRALPQGYNTQLEERGTNVSGGQLQRIAIARAVLGNPALLLLDEATSALDTESEHYVQLALGELTKGRTTIIIAHRLSTIINADAIAVIDSGSVVDVGTHSELLLRCDLYQRLASMQFKETPTEEAQITSPAA